MGYESAYLFGWLVVDCSVTGAGASVSLWTDLPVSMAQRYSSSLAVTSGRVPLRFRLPLSTRGHLVRLQITPGPTGIVRLYGAKVQVRRMGIAGGDWTWFPLYVPPTQDESIEVRIPIPPTPAEFAELQIAIPPTPPNFSELRIEIPPTPDQFSEVPTPIPPTSLLPQWVEMPIDQP